MDNFRLAALTALWYAASLLFNLGMKRSHALIPDVLVLTTLQFCVGAVALGVAWGFNAVRGPEISRQTALVCWSALLFFGCHSQCEGRDRLCVLVSFFCFFPFLLVLLK